MTKEDIFIQILSEVSNKPQQFVRELMKSFRAAHPGGKWDEEVPDQEAQATLAELRKEGPGILRWLEEGAADVRRFESDTIN